MHKNAYRGRLVSKNQMTIPVPMQRELDMAQGDELEFIIENGRVSDVHVLKPVRVDLLPDDVLKTLKHRKAAGSAQRRLSPHELKELTEGKKVDDALSVQSARVAARG